MQHGHFLGKCRQERQAITAAIQRLLAGKPVRSSGNLDIVTLAQEAGLKRNKLTHEHIDLEASFNAEVAAKNRIPDNEIELRQEIAELKERIAQLTTQRDHHKTANETFARAIHVLTVENEKLRNQLDNAQQQPRPRALRTVSTTP